LSGNWWKEEEEEAAFGGDNNEEFGWFDSVDAQNDDAMQSGLGDDGGAFGFGDDADFEHEEKEEEDLNADSWMTSMTQMDNVLDGKIKKKDTNKKNTKGMTMAQIAKTKPSKQAIPTSFGTDDFFNTNSNNTKNNDFDPFGLDNNQQQNNQASNNITSLYGNTNQNVFGGNNGFGYQGNTVSPYNNDPFAGIGGNVVGPQPAKYVSRQKKNDPFAQFGAMK